MVGTTVSYPIMKTLFISLATLVIGLLLGIAIVNYRYWHDGVVASPSNATAAPPATPSQALPDANEWDPFTEMRRLQEQMNQMMNQSSEGLHNAFPFNGPTHAPGYSLSLDLREFKDRFEVHAALPDAKASDINVKLEDDRTLSVEVGNKTMDHAQQGSASTTTEEWGKYTQTIQLPSAVQTNGMKVDHKDHELIVILPKA